MLHVSVCPVAGSSRNLAGGPHPKIGWDRRCPLVVRGADQDSNLCHQVGSVDNDTAAPPTAREHAADSTSRPPRARTQPGGGDREHRRRQSCLRQAAMDAGTAATVDQVASFVAELLADDAAAAAEACVYPALRHCCPPGARTHSALVYTCAYLCVCMCRVSVCRTVKHSLLAGDAGPRPSGPTALTAARCFSWTWRPSNHNSASGPTAPRTSSRQWPISSANSTLPLSRGRPEQAVARAVVQ